jgi:hypothetical protein
MNTEPNDDTQDAIPPEYQQEKHDVAVEDDIPHGTRNGYQYYQCKCDECRGAQSSYMKAQRQKNRAKRAAAPGGNAHPRRR